MNYIANAEKLTDTTTTFTATEICDHDTGAWKTIRFWIFTRKIYVCFKCGKLRYENKWGIR